jgi:putative aminopeptidase FrvX
MDQTEKMLQELTDAYGVTGHEQDVARIMARHLSSLCQISHDKLGSIIAKKKGTHEGPKIMLAGHMDEVGFMVKEITKEGFIKFLPLGGWWPHVLLSQRVCIRTSKGDVVGVVGSKAPHLLEAEERKKVQDIKDLYIDVGSTAKNNVAKKLNIRPGDPIVPISPFTVLSNKKAYLAKAWDDRIGCALIIDVIKRLARVKHPNTVYGVGTVQEEVGLRGATTSVSSVDPDVAFVLEVGLAMDTPGMNGEREEKLGGGPSLYIYDSTMIPNTRLRDLVIDVAEKKKIPYHFASILRGGTDGGKIHIHGIGVPTQTIGVPTRYIHGHAGILHRGDYDHTVALLTEVIRRLDAKTAKDLTPSP